jgi:hypothetical protein
LYGKDILSRAHSVTPVSKPGRPAAKSHGPVSKTSDYAQFAKFGCDLAAILFIESATRRGRPAPIRLAIIRVNPHKLLGRSWPLDCDHSSSPYVHIVRKTKRSSASGGDRNSSNRLYVTRTPTRRRNTRKSGNTGTGGKCSETLTHTRYSTILATRSIALP